MIYKSADPACDRFPRFKEESKIKLQALSLSLSSGGCAEEALPRGRWGWGGFPSGVSLRTPPPSKFQLEIFKPLSKTPTHENKGARASQKESKINQKVDPGCIPEPPWAQFLRTLIFDDGCMNFNGFSSSGGSRELPLAIKSASRNDTENLGQKERCLKHFFFRK